MENNQQKEIDFIIQLQILKTLVIEGFITKEMHDKAVDKLKAKSNCKLIVTSANF